MIGTTPVGVSKETYLDDVKKYPFNAISALFGAYVDVDRVRVWDFSKRSFCWVEICYPYLFSFINDHILKIHCLNGGQHYLFIDLKNSFKVKLSSAYVYHSSQCLLEETHDTLTVRPLSDLRVIQARYSNPNYHLTKRIAGSKIFAAKGKEIYELQDNRFELVAILTSRVVIDTKKALFMSDSLSDFEKCVDSIRSNPSLTALFSDDYPYVFGCIRGIDHCQNIQTGIRINTDMSPFLKRIQNGRLLLAGCGEVKNIDLKTQTVARGRFYLSIPNSNGDTHHFILLEDRDWRYLYDIDRGKIVHEYEADVKAFQKNDR